MAAHAYAAKTAEERLVFYAITLGWVWYALGALYLAAPLLEVALLGMYFWRLYACWLRPEGRPKDVPAGVWMWIAGMAGMLLALLIAHTGWDLGGPQTLKSAIGWLKGWALLAAFPLAGACLNIRPGLVVRALMWFAVQTLCLMPLLVAAGFAHAPQRLFVSPLQVVGGPGPEFFSVYLYTVDPSNGALRWQFIAPWAPAAGMLGDMIFVFASFERDRGLRALATVSAVLICLLTKSRMAVMFLGLYPPLIWALGRLARPAAQYTAAVLAALLGIVAGPVMDAVQSSIAAFRAARADSTRVREALGRIAVHRWREEAPIFGHGIVVRGPHYVEFMPIGSHHTWFGLLYVKGLAGVVALALPLLWTFAEMLALAQISALGRAGLSMMFMLSYYSGGENLEILAYLFWPGLLILGAAHREAGLRERHGPALPRPIQDTPTQDGERPACV